MSFTYNPFEHVELIRTERGHIQVHCHGCGADLGDYSPYAYGNVFFAAMAEHVRTSHGRTREDFAGWSKW